MTTFSKHLGELAGHDIVLWREAGLDPRVIDTHEGEGLDGLAHQAVGWVGWMCRRIALLVSACAPPSIFNLRPRAVHVRIRPHRADKG